MLHFLIRLGAGQGFTQALFAANVFHFEIEVVILVAILN